MMNKERFENGTGWKMSYEEYKRCYCPDCSRKNCVHREAYRRVPRTDGGLGLCPNLQNKERQVIIMSTRTLAAWELYSERTGKKNIADYLIVGDSIAEDLIIHIRNYMPLETDKPDYLQVNDIQGYCYDLARALRPVFPTFAECNRQWRYYGVCHKWETINRF